MAVIEFVQNYSDRSTDQGYQFEFHCDRCRNGYMSSYVPNRLDMAGGLLRAAGGLLGGVLGRLGEGAYDIQRVVGGPQHDQALQHAVTEIKPLFTQCHRCGQWVCRGVCWNAERGLCKQCAPILMEEAASAQATSARTQVQERAMQSDQTEGTDLAHKIAAQCSQCGTAATGGKFCAGCGSPLRAAQAHCVECGAQVPAGARFCPDCGHRA